MKKILLGILFLFAINLCPAQIVCDVGNPASTCPDSTTLSVVNGENITEKLRQALMSYCQVRIPNPGSQSVSYLLDPMTFSGDQVNPNTALQKKIIILEESVVIQTTQGGPSYCSQSMFTFDGEANRNISILGEYDNCDNRPIIKMPMVNYEADAEEGYLVASDDVDEPYLNINGAPNYVYSDFDADPYFDDLGNPNLITPQNQEPMVPADCDYNYNLCNRKIIVWCPLNWEGRHLIAMHGAQNVTIKGINVENASGGDGIILAASESGAPSKNILIDDVHFIQNGRTGLNVKSALCLVAEESYIAGTGDQIGIDSFVNINGGIALEPLADTTNSEYYMKNIILRTSSLAANDSFGIRINFPSLLNTTYMPEVEIEIDSICVNNSITGIEFDTSHFDLEGKIEIFNFQIFDVDTAFVVTKEWDSDNLDIELLNVDMSQEINLIDVYIEPGGNFCANLSATDVCMAYTTVLCNQIPGCDFSDNNTCTDNSAYSCIPDPEPPCPLKCTTEYELFACYNQPLTLEAKIYIDDIVADRPLPFSGWRNEIATDNCGLDGDLELCFDFADDDGRTIQVLGINSDPTTNEHFNTIDYGIYLLTLSNGTHRIRVLQNGTEVYLQNTGVNLVGTQFCIKRVDGNVSYLRDGLVFYTSTIPSDELMYFDNSFYSRLTGVWSQGSSTFSNITFSILNNPDLLWSPGGTTGPSLTVSVTENAVYSVSFPNGSADGCKNRFRFELTVVDTPALTPIIVDPNLTPLVYGTEITICDGEQVILSVEEYLGGNQSHIYDWSTPATAGATLPIGTAGTYNVTITDTLGCTQFLEFTVNVDPLPDVTLTGGHLTCDVLSVNITGPTGFNYDPPLPFAVTAPGEYCFLVTDPATGCSIEECATVTQNIVHPELDCKIAYTDVNGNTDNLNQCEISICPNECVVFSAQGSNLSDYNYQWSSNTNPGNNPWETVSICTTSDAYSVTITDPDNGCTQVLNFNVNVNPSPDITLTGGHLTCDVMSVAITGPAGYSYSPSLPFTVIDPGVYCFVVTDPNSGCTAEECVAVTQDIVNPNLDCQLIYTDVNGMTEELNQCTISMCPDECVVLAVQGNNLSGFNYQWSSNTNPGSDPWETVDICNTTDAYSVTITDQENGCTQVLAFNVNVDPTPNVTLTGGELTCAVTSLAITGPTGFLYSPSLPFTVSAPGTYSFVVTDPNTGCTAQENATVTQDITAPDFGCEITYTDAMGNIIVSDNCEVQICPSDCAVLAVHGNNLSDYTYSWSNNVTVGVDPWLTDDVCGPGTYSVTVTDPANGCSQELVFTVVEDTTCMTICNAPPLMANGGNVLQCFDFPGLPAGQNFTWEFFTGSLPDQLIITIGNQVVLNTGLISSDDTVCGNNPGLPVTTLSNFPLGGCVPLFPGSGVTAPGHPDYPGEFDLHGTIPITAALANQPIEICVDGTLCSVNTGWFLDIACSDLPGPCVDDPAGNPITTSCETSPNGTGILWDPVPGAATYEVILDQNPGDCCPGAQAAPPVIATTVGTSFTLPPNAPTCFTWLVIAYAGNGDVLATSTLECLNATTQCTPVNPPACPGIAPPSDVGCQSVNGVTSITWSPYSPIGIYTVSIQLGGSCCPGGGTNDGPTWFIYQVTGESFSIPPALNGQCFTFTVSSLCADYSSSDPSHPICYNVQDGCTPDPISTGCETSENGTGIIWETVSGAVRYEVIMNANQSSCCPDATGTSEPPIIGSTSGTSFTLTADAPDCFTWQVVAYNANGNVIATSPEECMNDGTDCIPVIPPPCPGLNPPLEVGCEKVDGQTTLFWSVMPSTSNFYSVTIEMGGSCCTEGGQNEGPKSYTFQVVGLSFTLPPELEEQCFTFSIRKICLDYSSSEATQAYCFDPEIGCVPEGGKKRSVVSPQILQKAFSIYPNPAKDQMNLSFENFAREKTDITIEIINSQSQIMRTIKTSIAGIDETININTQDMVDGLYFVKVLNVKTNDVYIRKVVLIK